MKWECGATPRPLAHGQPGFRGAGAEGADGLPPEAQGQPDSGVPTGLGGRRLQEVRDWEKVFGQSRVTDGIFMAWHFARYIGRVIEAGKAEYPIPMFVNAALYGLGRGPQPPPSGGRPWDLVMDV